MEKQTAVSYFVDLLSDIIGNLKVEHSIGIKVEDAILKAKELEKEQIMESFLDGVYEGSPTDEDYENCKVSGEQYYNKIYNK